MQISSLKQMHYLTVYMVQKLGLQGAGWGLKLSKVKMYPVGLLYEEAEKESIPSAFLLLTQFSFL